MIDYFKQKIAYQLMKSILEMITCVKCISRILQVAEFIKHHLDLVLQTHQPSFGAG